MNDELFKMFHNGRAPTRWERVVYWWTAFVFNLQEDWLVWRESRKTHSTTPHEVSNVPVQEGE